jgi:hypothetical protein
MAELSRTAFAACLSVIYQSLCAGGLAPRKSKFVIRNITPADMDWAQTSRHYVARPSVASRSNMTMDGHRPVFASGRLCKLQGVQYDCILGRTRICAGIGDFGPHVACGKGRSGFVDQAWY